MHNRKSFYVLMSLLLISCFHLSEGVGSTSTHDETTPEDPLPMHKQYNAGFFPFEVLDKVFKFIPLPDMLRVTLVSSDWEQIAREGAFKDFYTFMTAYKACAPLTKGLTFNSSCEVMTNLRNAQNTLMQSGRSQDEYKAIAEHYVKKWSTIKENEIKDHISNIAMLRIYHGLFEIGDDDFLIQWGPRYLLILAPKELLLKWFQGGELGNFPEEYRCAMASELCERPQFDIEIILNEANNARQQQNYEFAAPLLSIVLKKNPNLSAGYDVLAGDAYLELKDWQNSSHFNSLALKKNPNLPAECNANTGFAYMKLENWPMAALHYSTAFEKDSNLPAHNYVNAGYVFAKRNMDKEASDYFQKFIDRLGDNPINLFPDTLGIMEQVLQKTNADARYIEWVSNRRAL